ncbi:elongin-A-like [Cynocephalus volans]|uniref:elongin-A-like n=1 Tax=Cynocephalus volans TaxID=110931 RepID=UPI002FCB8F65
MKSRMRSLPGRDTDCRHIAELAFKSHFFSFVMATECKRSDAGNSHMPKRSRRIWFNSSHRFLEDAHKAAAVVSSEVVNLPRRSLLIESWRRLRTPKQKQQVSPAAVGEDPRAQAELLAVLRTELRPKQRRPPSCADEAAPGTAMAADGALHAVVKLQARLAAHSDPKKLAKYLKKLSALPVTAHSLAETGVRKTVKRLRTQQHVGSLARDLAAQGKKLLVVARDTRPKQLALEESRSRKRPREEFPKEPKVQGACPESHGASESPSDGTERGHRKHRRLSQLQTPPKGSPGGDRRGGSTKRYTVALASSSDWASSGDGHIRIRLSLAGPHQMCVDHCVPPEEEGPEPAVLRQKPGKGHADAPQGSPGLRQEGHLGKPRGQGAVVSPSPAQVSSHRQKGPAGAGDDEMFPAGFSQKSHKAFSPEEGPRAISGDSTKEKPPSRRARREKASELGCVPSLPALDAARDNHLEEKRDKDSDEPKADETKKPSPESLDTGEGAGGLLPTVPGKLSNKLSTREGIRRPSTWESSLPEEEELADMEADSEQPAVPFEAYSTYGRPWKGKERTVKTLATTLRVKDLHETDSKRTRENGSLLPRLAKVQENETEEPPPPGAHVAKLKRVPTDAPPVLPDLPLPGMRASDRALSVLELMSSFPPEIHALPSPQQEEEGGFPTGRRRNSKMPVYSGPRSAGLPRTVTACERRVWALGTSVPAVREAGGDPCPAPEPAWKGCTPDQPGRTIEKYNPTLAKETGHLWKRRCQRDFKEARPEEHESWREMYLRLREARERRLRLVTMKIRSARAERPRGRQTQMIFFHSVLDKPCEVPRRQEKPASGGAAIPDKAEVQPAPRPQESSRPPSSSTGGHSRFHPLPARPPSCGPSTRKAAAKKVAPLMAKTIRDYRNTYSRR